MTGIFQRNWRLRVKEVAEAKGMTKERLASLAHLPQETIDHLWSDPTSDVWLATLSQLADALQVRLTTLLAEGEEKPLTEPPAPCTMPDRNLKL